MTAVLPSDVTDHVSAFDRFAERAATFVSRPGFFAFCVITILVWLPSRPLFATNDQWQLPVNTFTTIVTFLMVAILENANARSNGATQHKLSALAQAQADLMRFSAESATPSRRVELLADVRELERAVGLEHIESA